MAGDIFAPPTSQELAMFAPPTQAELSANSSSSSEAAPGYGESALRGFAQGASLRFADEIAGGAGALSDAAKQGSVSDLVANYIKNRDAYRAEDARAQAANPKTFEASQLGGGLATAFIPGLNIGKIASLGGRALAAGGLGAIAAIGNSKADLTQGDIGGAAKDAALGFGTGAVLQPAIEKVVAPAIGAAYSGAKGFAGSLGKKVLNAGFDVPEEVSSRYLANPEAVNNALPTEGVAQKIADTLGEVRSDTGAANEAALSTLSSDRPNSGMSVRDAVDLLNKFGSGDSGAKQLAQRLNEEFIQRNSGAGLTGTPEANAGFLNEEEMHEVKKTLQGLADWKSPLPTADQAGARLAAGDINQTLKSDNQDYQTAMGDLAQNIQSKNALAQKFAIAPDYSGANDSGFTYTDRTLSAIKDLVRNNKVDRARILDGLKDQGYGDLAEDIKNSLANEKLNGPGIPNGSRKAVSFGNAGMAAGSGIGYYVGGGSGAVVGGVLGKGIGSVIGAGADKYGPQIAKAGLDATILMKQLSESPGAQKFVGAIQSAASRGQGALAATHFILSQTQPDYQKAVQGQ